MASKPYTTKFLSSLTSYIWINYNYNTSTPDIKNNYSNDNKYLAVVNDSGLWLKDETEEGIAIVKSSNIEDNYLNNVIINQFDFNFNLIKTIQSNKVDISNKNWVIYKPTITKQNITSNEKLVINLKSNFQYTSVFIDPSRAYLCHVKRCEFGAQSKVLEVFHVSWNLYENCPFNVP